jgi:hypothetical protein
MENKDEILVSEINGWWEVVTANPNDPENPVVTKVHKHSTKTRPTPPEISPELFIRQAPPVKIIPSRKQIPIRDSKIDIFLPDTQYPHQDKRAIKLAMVACKALSPDGITWLGDDVDATNFSKFESRQEWQGSLQKGLDEFHADAAQIKADNPQAKLVLHEGNHNVRLERMIRLYNGDLIGLKRANAGKELGVLTLGFLLRLNELSIQHITGYPNSEFWHSDVLKSYHGTQSVSRGSTMARVLLNETVNVVQGHSHKAELVYRTLRIGREERTIFGLNPGHLSDKDRLPSGKYATTESGAHTSPNFSWQQSVGVVFHNEEFASPHILPITDAGINIFGKVYKS